MLAQFRADQLSATAAQAELQLSKTRFYELYAAYLRAAAQGQADRWIPGSSGGDHHGDWPPAVITQLTALLAARPPSSYSACASELLCRLNCKTDRASIRRRAGEHHLAPDTRYKQPPPPVKRWQARDLGAQWPYDATPHPFLPGSTAKQCLLNPSTTPAIVLRGKTVPPTMCA